MDTEDQRTESGKEQKEIEEDTVDTILSPSVLLVL